MDRADKIARDLVTPGGSEEICESLRLYTSDGRYMGGWSLEGLSSRIRKHLRGEFGDEPVVDTAPRTK